MKKTNAKKIALNKSVIASLDKKSLKTFVGGQDTLKDTKPIDTMPYGDTLLIDTLGVRP